MFGLFKHRACFIGVEMGDDSLKLVQLVNNGKGISLLAGISENRPENVKSGTGAYQRWAIDTVRQLTANGRFKGKEVIATIPTSEVFIDHIKMPKVAPDKLADAIFSRIRQKLPFEPIQKNVMIKYIPTEQDNVLVMVTERKIIDRHLAIYEKAGLVIKAIGVWPIALANTYSTFFGRRKTDLQAIVMLISIEPSSTNVVICRHKRPLFAHVIPIGAKQLHDRQIITRLVLELTACKRHFSSMYRNCRIERLVFLSSKLIDNDVCITIAKQLDMPAQWGDCLAAVEIAEPRRLGRGPNHNNGCLGSPIDRRDCQVNWATAFGLSLS